MRFDWLVTPEIQQRMLAVAREFRKEPTRSEASLWEWLRGRRLAGHKFRRQQPIGSFVVDFYCDEAALIVEVDGPIHDFQRQADRERQAILESLGLRMLRVKAAEVEWDIDGVLERIKEGLLSPLPRGEGIGVRAPPSR